jgi:antitoxin (DNA-binding transcriptional repressor) of toxin-antitoxin stability system
VLQRVSEGERITVTVNRVPVAELKPLPTRRPQFFEAAQLITLLERHRADPGLTDVLADLAGDTTDDMDVVTQDDDFDPIEAVGGPNVIRV